MSARRTRPKTAIVVGSGPNGLTAAIHLARAGLEVRVVEAAEQIGGGTRSSELTVPDVVHDECAAVHPLGVVSPAFTQLGLERYGLSWCWPDVDLAHPFDDGDAALLYRDIDRTADGLGADGRRWKRLFGPLANRFDETLTEVMRPALHWPAHPLRLASFAARAALPASVLVSLLSTPRASALFGGIAAHAMTRLDRPMSSAAGVILATASHVGGWPVARGGSASITTALAAALADAGGQIDTGIAIGSWEQLDGADIVVLGTTPAAAAAILGDRMPAAVRRSYVRYRHGPGAHKLDIAVRGDIPWANEACVDAGTVHLGGSFSEIASAEAAVGGGELPVAPFTLVGQQYRADPSRSSGDVHPIWAYSHVPAGWGDERAATERTLDQIERFAPGFRDRIIEVHVRDNVSLEGYNRNYVGGDIAVGHNSARQLLFRPRAAIDPYATGVDGVVLCSSATPPGGGVHGMCGLNAAASALRAWQRAE